MVRDPVCGMLINEERARHWTVYDGEEYCFCSSDCKRAFNRRPEGYVFPGTELEEAVLVDWDDDRDPGRQGL